MMRCALLAAVLALGAPKQGVCLLQSHAFMKPLRPDKSHASPAALDRAAPPAVINHHNKAGTMVEAAKSAPSLGVPEAGLALDHAAAAAQTGTTPTGAGTAQKEPEKPGVAAAQIEQEKPGAAGRRASLVGVPVKMGPDHLPMEMPFDPKKTGVSSDTIICAVMALVGVVVGVVAWVEWSKLPRVEAKLSRDSGRLFLLDNVKWFAQLMVIFGHLLDSLHVWDTKTWLNGEDIFIFNVKFAMEVVLNPLFCFISGVLSQGAPTEGRLRRYVQFLVVPTVLVVYLIHPICNVLFMQSPFDKELDKVIQPDFSSAYFYNAVPWYLFALLMWRASVYLLWAQMRTDVAFVAMVTASCVGGYIGGINAPWGGGGMGAMLGYMPYFALGYVAPFPALAARIPKPGPLGATGVALGVWVYAYYLVPAVFGLSLPDGHGNYMSGDPGKLIVNTGTLSAWDVNLYWLRRLARMAVDTPAVLAVIFLVLPRGETPITYMGAYTLFSYIFHSHIGFQLWRPALLQALGVGVVDNFALHVLIILAHIPFCLAVMAVLTSSYWRVLWSWAISPEWLSVIFIPASPKPAGKPAGVPPPQAAQPGPEAAPAAGPGGPPAATAGQEQAAGGAGPGGPAAAAGAAGGRADSSPVPQSGAVPAACA